MSELFMKQRAFMDKDFLYNVKKRSIMGAILYIPVVYVFGNMGTAMFSVQNFLESALRIAVILAFSIGFDAYEYWMNTRRLAKCLALAVEGAGCFTILYRRGKLRTSKKYGMLLLRDGAYSFYSLKDSSIKDLGAGAVAEESQKYYIIDNYSLKKKKLRPLVEVTAGDSSEAFDVLIPADVLAALNPAVPEVTT